MCCRVCCRVLRCVLQCALQCDLQLEWQRVVVCDAACISVNVTGLGRETRDDVCCSACCSACCNVL